MKPQKLVFRFFLDFLYLVIFRFKVVSSAKHCCWCSYTYTVKTKRNEQSAEGNASCATKSY